MARLALKASVALVAACLLSLPAQGQSGIDREAIDVAYRFLAALSYRDCPNAYTNYLSPELKAATPRDSFMSYCTSTGSDYGYNQDTLKNRTFIGVEPEPNSYVIGKADINPGLINRTERPYYLDKWDQINGRQSISPAPYNSPVYKDVIIHFRTISDRGSLSEDVHMTLSDQGWKVKAVFVGPAKF